MTHPGRTDGRQPPRFLERPARVGRSVVDIGSGPAALERPRVAKGTAVSIDAAITTATLRGLAALQQHVRKELLEQSRAFMRAHSVRVVKRGNDASGMSRTDDHHRHIQ